MEIYTQNPIMIDSDAFFNASGKRRMPLFKSSRRKKREREERRAARQERRDARVARRERRSIPQGASNRPAPRRRPSPKRSGGAMPPAKRQVKTTPLPEGLPRKQGVAATTQQEQPKDNKMLYIVGGVAALALVGFLFFRK